MRDINKTCPHCHADPAEFILVACNNITKYTYSTFATGTNRQHNRYCTFWSCRSCGKGIVVIAEAKETNNLLDNMIKQETTFFEDVFTQLEMHPKIDVPTAPKHSPPTVANFYVQGVKSYKQESWDACASMMRKALEASLILKDSNNKSDNLKQRINKMCEKGLITEDMATWAQEIRVIGNDAVHGIEVLNEDDAKDALNFTELFLTYVFTLPGEMETRRQSKQNTTSNE
jgi:hypothetical protein